MSSNLSSAIMKAKSKGLLGLTVYTIPGYPNPEQYQKILRYLDECPEVSIIENTFPVNSRFSPYANQTIKEAHKLARAYYPAELSEELLKTETPVLCVLYQQTVLEYCLREMLNRYSALLDGVVLEWEPENVEELRTEISQHDIEFIHELDPDMRHEEIKAVLQLVRQDGHIYFVTAPHTGADLFSVETISKCVEYVKQIRPDVTLSAGFGVKTPTDVVAIAGIDGIDGVIIGTAAIQAMASGIEGLQAYLDKIIPSLKLISKERKNVE